jgi:hypothetical protein
VIHSFVASPFAWRFAAEGKGAGLQAGFSPKNPLFGFLGLFFK